MYNRDLEQSLFSQHATAWLIAAGVCDGKVLTLQPMSLH